mmetsp:Transcript_17167/g.26132  ORF Transcript_17167/g.26132 Transcript_17167/m.26132 type:complete len:736 (-) Transcript_17167:35-2242(-)
MSNNLVTLYRCDVCHKASFPTMEEAIAHENKCALVRAHAQAQAAAAPPPPQPPQQPTTRPPQAVAATQPPVTTKNNPPTENLLRVKYFKCSNCKILFTNRAKARIHETSCNEPVWFSCRVCKIMRFSKASTLIEHERICKGPVPLTRKDLPLADEILKQKENGNGGHQSDDSSVEIIEPPIKPKPMTPSRVPNPLSIPAPQQRMQSKKDDASVEIVDPPRNNTAAPLPPSADVPTHKRESSYITCWTCDVCKVAHFKTYKEAEDHEIQCKIDMDNKKKAEEKKIIDMEKKRKEKEALPKHHEKVEYNSDSRQPAAKHVVLFSPFVQSVTDSADFEKISNCHAAILQSVKLLHHPFNGSVALQCQYCNQGMSSTWTYKKMTEMLPVLVCNHILECQNAPAEVVESMQQHITNILNKSSEIIGELSFGKFLESFLPANGIVEGAIKGDKQLVVMPDDKFKKINGCEMSKRGRHAGSSTALIGTKKGKRQDSSSVESSPSAKRPKQLQSVHDEIKIGDMDCQLHYDEGRSMYVGPLDGLPLLTSMLQKEAKYLPPSQKVLLAQLEIFELSPKIMKGASNGSLGLRCQNCVTEKNGCCFMKLTSVNNLARDVLLFGKEHVVRCVTRQKVTKQIHESLVAGEGELSKYCKLLANLYCLEQRHIGGKIHVKFGECPTIPAGYCRPCDIDFRSILRDAETNRMNADTVGEASKVLQKAPAQDELKAPQAPAVVPVAPPVDVM